MPTQNIMLAQTGLGGPEPGNYKLTPEDLKRIDEETKMFLERYPEIANPYQNAQIGGGGPEPNFPSEEPTVEEVPKGFIKKIEDGIKGFTQGGYQPSFPATTGESYLPTAGKLLGNIPSSTLQFAKGIVNFLNPLDTASKFWQLGQSIGEGESELGGLKKVALETAKGLPRAAYDTLVPKFIHSLVQGNWDQARQTLVNDPVGQIGPLILTARAIAEVTGKGAAFDSGMKKITQPVIQTVTAPARFIGSTLGGTLGITTGVGKGAIERAATGSEAFTRGMRGEVSPEGIVQDFTNAVEDIRDIRRVNYLNRLDKIQGAEESIDISPITDELDTQLNNFGVKVKRDGTLDFSRSSIANKTEATSDITNVYETIKDWGSKPGDRTAIGLDTLKQQLTDLYSPSGNARAFVSAIKNKVRNILDENVEGYKEMTSEYAKTSNLLEDIKSSTGIGGKASNETIFRKLTTAMRQDKELAHQILEKVQGGSNKELVDELAGQSMSNLMPRGLIGKGLDVFGVASLVRGILHPQAFLAFLSSSPRIVGEFLRAAGMTTSKVKQVVSDVANVKIPNIPIVPNTKEK